MPLNDFLKEFGLDPELIDRDRAICAGLANAHENFLRDVPDSEADNRFMHAMMSATEHRRAGAHSLLLSDRKAASDMFRKAGRLYASLRKPYALMMFICSEGDLGSAMATAHDFGWADGIERTQLCYLLLAAASGWEDRDRELFRRISHEVETSQSAPIGTLGIPVGAYLDLGNTLIYEKPSPTQMTETLLPFLAPYSIALRRCMRDIYHWQRLAFPFHPAEPDVLAVLFWVEATLRWRQQGSLLGLIEEMSLGNIAASLLNNAIVDRFERDGPELRHR